MTPTPFRIVIPLYPEVTHLDFTGPHQIFSRFPKAELICASLEGGSLTFDGLTFGNLNRLSDINSCQMICIPGGVGTVEAVNDAAFIAEIRRLGASATYLTSVCTGSLILGAAGFLTGRRAACHWAWRDLLAEFGAIVDAGRVVRDGPVFTGGGVTAGIDLALTIAAEIYGPEIAQSIQLTLEYAPQPPFEAGRPETAPQAVLDRVRDLMTSQSGPRRQAFQRAAATLGVGR